MLDLMSLAPHIREAGKRERERQDRIRDAISLAASVSRMDTETWQKTHVPRLQTAQAHRLFAHASEPPCVCCPPPCAPEKHIVVSVDGSQIVPDRENGLSSCYLLNMGQVILRYGTGERSTLKSESTLIPLDSDDEESERQVLKSLAVRRYGNEVTTLAALAVECAGAENLPTVALADGSLVAWFFGGKGDEEDAEKQQALIDLMLAFDMAAMAGVPFVGYVSNPGSRDVVNALSTTLCQSTDFPHVCRACERADENPACHSILSATDAALFADLLKPGERSPVFTSQLQSSGQSQVLRQYYPCHWICFFYLNVGVEVARVEFPYWVADDPKLLDLAHSVCYDQSRKGMGYPIALTEAHEQAVVRGADREMFLNLLERATVQAGAPASRTTRKAFNKRVRPL